MPSGTGFLCGCPNCTREDNHLDKLLHRHLNLLLSRLDEQQRRWLVALESMRHGHGGITLMAAVTGMSIATIRRGRAELDAGLKGRPVGRARLPGGGRPPTKERRT